MRLFLTSEKRAVMGFPVTALFILQNFCTLKKYKRAAINVVSSHPTLYVNKRRTKNYTNYTQNPTFCL